MKPLSIPTDDLDHEAAEELLVHEWRVEQLRRLGVSRLIAETFADAVDWHAVAELVNLGCSPLLALQIVF